MGLQSFLMNRLIENSAIGKKIQSGNDVSKKGQFALDATEKNPNIEDSMAEKIANLENETKKIDNSVKKIISLPNGASTGDAQIEEAKVGIEGETYDTLGDAIREQVKTYRDVDVSNSKPTGKARVWVNTASNDSESQDILLPQVDDNNVSDENTWSSKKIDSCLSDYAIYYRPTKWTQEIISNGGVAIEKPGRILSSSMSVKRGTVVSSNGKYEFTVHVFDANGKQIRGGEEWTTDDFVVDYDDVTIRVQCRKPDDSDIDVNNVVDPVNVRFILSAQKETVIELGESLDNLKANVSYNSIIWSNSRFTNGAIVDSSKRALSHAINLVRGSILMIDPKSGFEFTVHVFDSNGSHLSGGEAWSTDIYTMLYDNSYALIQLRKADDSEFDATQIPNRLFTIKTVKDRTVDLFMFMGQSNMAGRGIVSDVWGEAAPNIIDGAGYEFRAISDPTKLYDISEPFGVKENNPSGINDGTMKTGSMVTSFINAYYGCTGIKVIGVSASKGGSKLSQWQPTSKEGYLKDAIQRLNDTITYLTNNGYIIRHKYMLWCQGESDGDANTQESDFKTMFNTMLDSMITAGIEKLFMVRIGNCNVAGSEDRYKQCIKYETEIAQTNEHVVMVSCDFAGMRSRGLMKDSYHYYQAGYNECGTHAGINTAYYVNTHKEPTMYDTEYNSLYFSHKN